MHSLLLATLVKRLLWSGGLALILSLLLLINVTSRAHSSWLKATEEYNKWSSQAESCITLFRDANEQLSNDYCKKVGLRLLGYFDCVAEQRILRPNLINKLERSGCPISYGGIFSLGSDIPSLNSPNNPKSFFEYALANIALPMLGIFAILLVCLYFMTSIGSAFLVEKHLGWRRIAIVLSIIAALIAPSIYVAYDSRNIFPNSLIVSFAAFFGFFALILYGRKLVLWVNAGFDSQETSQTLTATSSQKNTSSSSPTLKTQEREGLPHVSNQITLNRDSIMEDSADGGNPNIKYRGRTIFLKWLAYTVWFTTWFAIFAFVFNPIMNGGHGAIVSTVAFTINVGIGVFGFKLISRKFKSLVAQKK